MDSSGHSGLEQQQMDACFSKTTYGRKRITSSLNCTLSTNRSSPLGASAKSTRSTQDVKMTHRVLLLKNTLTQSTQFLPSVHMSLSTYVHPEPPVQTQIVALGIRDTNYFLSCHLESDVPSLRVEVKASRCDGCIISSEKY